MFTLIKYPLILLIFLAGIIPMASAQTMYRYTKNGDSIISSNLPPDVVNEGYEILSPRGNIIETVPPRKSKQQIKQQQAQEQLAAQAQKKQALIEQQQAEQRKKDQLLLKMFNSKEGIKRVHKNKIEAIENIEKISQDNLKKLNKKLSKAQQREAQLSDSNRAIPAKLQEEINEAITQLELNKQFLEQKAQEKIEVNNDFQQLLEDYSAAKARQDA